MRLRALVCAGLCLALAGPAVMFGQDAAPAKKAFTSAPIAPADSFNALLSLTESEVVGAADAMPAEKYDFAPPTTMGLYTGVRTYGPAGEASGGGQLRVLSGMGTCRVRWTQKPLKR